VLNIDSAKHSAAPESAAIRARSEAFIQSIDPLPTDCSGAGIVICAGGPIYLLCAWVTIHMLRRLGSKLEIEVWHLGRAELPEAVERELAALGVTCIDAREMQRLRPARILNGWELKPYAIVNTRFAEVLLLDADNIPVRDPAFLFATPEFHMTGAVFWPDIGRLSPENPVWDCCGVPYREESEFESGQMLVNKARCWRALKLAMWYNEHSDIFYRYMHGDKDTYHLAFRKLRQPYTMIPGTPARSGALFFQNDPCGRLLFQHGRKWTFENAEECMSDFQYEDECRLFVREFKRIAVESGWVQLGDRTIQA
jgi:hypothetical protein